MLRATTTKPILLSRVESFANWSSVGMCYFGVHWTQFLTLAAPHSPVLLVYDCVLTSKDELDLIWRRRKSVASVIFVANRVPAALFVVITSMLNASIVSSLLVSSFCANVQS